MPKLRCSAHSDKTFADRLCRDPHNTLAGHPARFFVSIRKGLVVGVAAYFARTAWNDVQIAAARKFGAATGDKDAVSIWHSGEDYISLGCQDAKKSDCFITLISLEQIAKFKEDERREKSSRDNDM